MRCAGRAGAAPPPHLTLRPPQKHYGYMGAERVAVWRRRLSGIVVSPRALRTEQEIGRGQGGRVVLAHLVGRGLGWARNTELVAAKLPMGHNPDLVVRRSTLAVAGQRSLTSARDTGATI